MPKVRIWERRFDDCEESRDEIGDDDCPECRGRGDDGCLTCGGEGYLTWSSSTG